MSHKQTIHFKPLSYPNSQTKNKTKIIVGKRVSQKLVEFGSVFEELRTNFWWLGSLSFTPSAAKGKNKVEPDISYSSKNERGEESCSSSFKRLFSRMQFTIEQN